MEVWATLTTLPGTSNSLRLNARVQQPGSSANDGYELRTIQQTGTDQVLLERIDNGTLKTLLTLNQELAVGDTLLLRVRGSTLEAWLYDGTSWSRLGSLTDTTYPAAGYVGVGLRGTSARLDDFGARMLGSATAPGPPALTASAGSALVHLSWAAGSTGGSPITAYAVYRGTSPGSETLLTTLGQVTSYDDTAVTNGTTYYYRVSASNAIGEGPLSNEVSALPSAAPATPLPTLDDFNRPDENPLSDLGRWSNGILSSGENGLKVVSNALACSRTTTCTGWRNDAQYGPDVEVWATLTTLPGTSNSLRLNARVQQPGSSANDGYELRTIQQTGTDQVLLERIDNGTLKTLLTLNQELAVGDTLLLRVRGSMLEAWLYDGASWSRLGSLTDTTYPAAGYVGVGLRGTSARLDDFGARKQGAPRPPGAPSAWRHRRRGTSRSPLLDRAVLRRGLRDHGLRGLSEEQPEPNERSHSPTWARRATTTATSQRHHLLLRGVRAERARRALERDRSDHVLPTLSPLDDFRLPSPPTATGRPSSARPTLGVTPLPGARASSSRHGGLGDPISGQGKRLPCGYRLPVSADGYMLSGPATARRAHGLPTRLRQHPQLRR